MILIDGAICDIITNNRCEYFNAREMKIIIVLKIIRIKWWRECLGKSKQWVSLKALFIQKCRKIRWDKGFVPVDINNYKASAWLQGKNM